MIIVHWENAVAWMTPKAQKKALLRWSHTAKAFGETRLILIDVDSVEPFVNDAEITLQVVTTLEEALALAEGEVVYVEEGGTPLADFQHPENACYVFGSDFGQLPKATVSIPSKLSLHADMAMAIVLADRYLTWH